MVNAIQMIQGFTGIYPAAQRLMFVVSAAAGTLSGVIGFYKLVSAGHGRGGTHKEAFSWLIVGAVLIDLTWAMRQTTETFFPGSHPLEAMAYAHPSGNAAQVLAQAAVGMMVLLGWGAGMRGAWLIHGTSHGKDTLFSGFTHLLAGGLLVNIVQVIGAVTTQLGLGTSWESTLGLH
mgnify:CR=1 FL=1